ncbi:MAG: hypothetical protein G8237_01290 [Magnetococcales bacterium]|nr:hypothetical protein [Magnetococcales bacterium]NGZ04971.1 hypothetical protein [Magnetococcales bacterium]
MTWLHSILIGITLFATVIQTWHHPVLTTALLTITLIAQARLTPHPNDKRAMLAAALLGTPAEAISVHLGEWTYHAPNLILGLPIWIPLIWANLFPLYRRLGRLLHPWIFGNEQFKKKVYITLSILIILYGYATLTLMHKTPIIHLLYSGFLIAMAGFWRSSMDLLLFVIGASLGTLGEYTCVQLGYWHYYNPYFQQAGIDITLAMDWGLSTVIIHRIAESTSSHHHT